MICYADTGFLVSLHSRDANTTAARNLMKRRGMPMAWTWLHEVEFRNAIRLQAFRGQIEHADVDAILIKQALGLDNGVYSQMSPALAEVNRQVERLGAIHTKTLGVRTLDIMHVAQALVLGLQDFRSFDKRQNALAKAAGLRIAKL